MPISKMAKYDKIAKFGAYFISFLGVKTVPFMERSRISAIAHSEQAFSTLPNPTFLF